MLYKIKSYKKDPTTHHKVGSTTSLVAETTTGRGLDFRLPLKVLLALVAQEVNAGEMHPQLLQHHLRSLSSFLFLQLEI